MAYTYTVGDVGLGCSVIVRAACAMYGGASGVRAPVLVLIVNCPIVELP